MVENAVVEAPFYERLADAMERSWITGDPRADVPINFVGVGGRFSKSIREIALEIRGQTPFGKGQTEFYLGISGGIGDPSGDKVIQDILNWWDEVSR